MLTWNCVGVRTFHTLVGLNQILLKQHNIQRKIQRQKIKTYFCFQCKQNAAQVQVKCTLLERKILSEHPNWKPELLFIC